MPTGISEWKVVQCLAIFGSLHRRKAWVETRIVGVFSAVGTELELRSSTGNILSDMLQEPLNKLDHSDLYREAVDPPPIGRVGGGPEQSES